ncbi:MAG: IS66 family insertion sequence element accessory protein TnpB [Gammaproteobacteria bacterium]|nr:IS66 family insertion sequence element accessory protein TnpB [Gammaproteobacteria bacterium]
MIRPGDDSVIYLYRHAVDMRKSINGLVAIVEGELEMDPFSSTLFIFCNTNRTLVKMVGWEGNGFILWMKRIDKARFRWPVNLPLDCVELSAQQINWLLDGYDLTLLQGHASLPHHTVL